VRELRAGGWRHVMIEVATDIRRALYQACGFREIAMYGCFELEIMA
jgi:hypothetical protein